jgi:hypothetical protein
MEWLLEIVLVLLLAVTLFHALRLERALGVLQRDRGALEELIGRFNTSTRQAEHGVEQLRAVAEGSASQLSRQMQTGMSLKDDLVFLVERGERLADRLDGLVRAARPLAQDAGRPEWLPAETPPQPDLTDKAPRRSAAAHPQARSVQSTDETSQREVKLSDALPSDAVGTTGPVAPRVRSQAERDLLNALRAVR